MPIKKASPKIRNEIKQWSQEFDFFIIKGKRLKRKRFGTESFYANKAKTCEICEVKPGFFHIWGCSYEESICTIHEGNMIDCSCDEY
jgi:hypothetical protein